MARKQRKSETAPTGHIPNMTKVDTTSTVTTTPVVSTAQAPQSKLTTEIVRTKKSGAQKRKVKTVAIGQGFEK